MSMKDTSNKQYDMSELWWIHISSLSKDYGEMHKQYNFYQNFRMQMTKMEDSRVKRFGELTEGEKG